MKPLCDIINIYCLTKTFYVMKKVENLLLECGAVKFNAQHPFTYKSGMLSPIYCDAKSIAGFPLVYPQIIKSYQEGIYKLWKEAGEPMYLTIAAVDGAVFWTTLAASTILKDEKFKKEMYKGHDNVSGLPISWVLPAPKDHGLFKQIDGAKIGPDNAVIIVENVIKTGKTALDAVQAVRLAGGKVLGIVALMSYDLPKVKEALKKIPVVTLTTYDKLVAAAVENDYLSKSQVDVVKAWHKDPYNWK